MNNKFDFAIVYCDGACSGNPGPGGWGSIVCTPDLKVRELGGHQSKTTNNQMELVAATEALRFLAGFSGPVVVYTDSVYVIRGITQWIWGWMKRDWKTAEGAEVLNKEYWQDLQSVVGSRKGKGSVTWKYTRGHSGTPGNERCDEIAVKFSKQEYIKLFNGSVSDYSFDILTLPTEQPIPDMTGKGKGPKASAHSYLSVLGGIALRHKIWPECERRVKGQAGAKFKKAMSADEEREILRGWGVDPKSVRDT